MSVTPELHLPLPVTELLPHRGGLLLLDELAEASPDWARSSLIVAPDGLFIDDAGELEPTTLVECLAQLVAALRGYVAKCKGEEPHLGFLVGVRDFTIAGAARVGDRLGLELKEVAAVGKSSVTECSVKRDGQLLAAGMLKLWEEEGPPPGVELDFSSQDFEVNKFQRGAIAQALEADVQLQQRGEDWLEGELPLADSFPGFAGHFPGFPILPGVILLQLGSWLLKCAVAPELKVSAVEQAKFSRQVFPGDKLRARIGYERQDDDWRAQVKVMREGAKIATMTLRAGDSAA